MGRGGGRPDAFRLMVVLNILKTGDINSCGNMYNIGETTARTYFIKFVTSVNEKQIGSNQTLYSTYVHMPTNDELRADMKVYAALGLPGCFASIDGTHLKWKRAPVSMRSLYKSGYKDAPTLNIQMAVTHCTRIITCSKAYPGNIVDSTIFKIEPDTMLSMEGEENEVEFEVFERHLNRVIKRKCLASKYFIADNGYHDCNYIMHPITDYKYNILRQTMPLDEAERMKAWSDRIESVRKDIERTFGILKMRFSMLEKPLLFTRQEEVTKIVRTCCFLHNFHLQTLGKTSENQILRISSKAGTESSNEVDQFTKSEKELQEYKDGLEDGELDPISFEREDGPEAMKHLRRYLVNHFTICEDKRLLYWPSGFYEEPTNFIYNIRDPTEEENRMFGSQGFLH